MIQSVLIDVACAIVCGVVVWIVKTTVPYIKAKLESTQYSWAADIIDYTVRAYEQMTEGSGQGDHKYQMVLNQVKAEFEKLGIKLTDRQISTLIEAAVQAMNAEQDIVKIGVEDPEPNPCYAPIPEGAGLPI